jgi:outer membrane protein assembly factor BamE
MSISACSILQPYQPTLGQGNFIRESQVEKLELGQTPKQVMLLLGTPLLTGELTSQRWIYPSYEEDLGYNQLIIEFEAGLVSKIERN